MRRLLMLVPLACLLLPAVAGCGGDDDGDGGGDQDKAAAEPTSVLTGDPKKVRQRAARTVSCAAEVRTTGAYDAEWSGEAIVRTGGKSVDASGPNAVYKLDDDGNRLALYSAGPGFEGSISLSADGLAFSATAEDATSFDVDKRGRHATVESTLTEVGGKELQLTAEFTCGKGKKKER